MTSGQLIRMRQDLSKESSQDWSSEAPKVQPTVMKERSYTLQPGLRPPGSKNQEEKPENGAETPKKEEPVHKETKETNDEQQATKQVEEKKSRNGKADQGEEEKKKYDHQEKGKSKISSQVEPTSSPPVREEPQTSEPKGKEKVEKQQREKELEKEEKPPREDDQRREEKLVKKRSASDGQVVLEMQAQREQLREEIIESLLDVNAKTEKRIEEEFKLKQKQLVLNYESQLSIGVHVDCWQEFNCVR
jgi:hypothetical protein